jgi:hypothetical protein
MTYVVFSTQAAAITAQYLISQNMQLPACGSVASTGVANPQAQWTTVWAVPRETLAGTWVFPAPAASYLAGVVGYTTAAYDPTWFPILTMS